MTSPETIPYFFSCWSGDATMQESIKELQLHHSCFSFHLRFYGPNSTHTVSKVNVPTAEYLNTLEHSSYQTKCQQYQNTSDVWKGCRYQQRRTLQTKWRACEIHLAPYDLSYHWSSDVSLQLLFRELAALSHSFQLLLSLYGYSKTQLLSAT